MKAVSFRKTNSMARSAVNGYLRPWDFCHMLGMHRATSGQIMPALAVLLLMVVTMWSYWPTIADLFKAWLGSQDYSACLIVPPIAAFLVWRERKTLGEHALKPYWWGAGLLILAEVARTYSHLSIVHPAVSRYALLLAMAGLVLMAAGWQVFRRVFWILLFLLLMIPLPGRVHSLISLPLQTVATTGAVFLLEACGTTVSRQGNIVVLNGETPLTVAEACSGLRMLIAFVIAAAFIAYLVQRPRWQKAVLLVSSIPVAVICNVIRIFVTALLMLYVGSEVGQKFFHDIGGFVMIAVAVSLLFGEIRLLDRLIVSESPDPARPLIVSARPAAKGCPKAATR